MLAQVRRRRLLRGPSGRRRQRLLAAGGGPNGALSLAEARRNFEACDVCDPAMAKNVRAPSREERIGRRPYLEEIEAAAIALDAEGRFHGWWPLSPPYRDLDAIGKEEFDALVERVLMAAARVRRTRRMAK
ncbi:CPCC family cysteine-rich protein [Caulobacter sp. KR2-114]|uniref:CPCC family cysteine-rich protein n=1 Tax=Caulobacter sp. KR2-114 TaxID=3400912 RepID=UPI003C05B759